MNYWPAGGELRRFNNVLLFHVSESLRDGSHAVGGKGAASCVAGGRGMGYAMRVGLIRIGPSFAGSGCVSPRFSPMTLSVSRRQTPNGDRSDG